MRHGVLAEDSRQDTPWHCGQRLRLLACISCLAKVPRACGSILRLACSTIREWCRSIRVLLPLPGKYREPWSHLRRRRNPIFHQVLERHNATLVLPLCLWVCRRWNYLLLFFQSFELFDDEFDEDEFLEDSA